MPIPFNEKKLIATPKQINVGDSIYSTNYTSRRKQKFIDTGKYLVEYIVEIHDGTCVVGVKGGEYNECEVIRYGSKLEPLIIIGISSGSKYFFKDLESMNQFKNLKNQLN